MNGGRSLAVEVAQAQSHVMKNGIAGLFWKNAILLNAGGEITLKKLHDQHRHLLSLLKVDSQELDNIGVAYLTE